ncbi:MAG: NAD-glutamate dehydrogenase, partial [Solirubrobacterales bacterium]|nr:NAD-glutamate dehydrogenase [Solirubrobacterales bacterium]
FVDCLVCIPRERFNTENRERVASILQDAFAGTAVEWSVHLSESVIARVHYVVHCDDNTERPEVEVNELEKELARATRAWGEDLREALIAEHGEEQGRRLFKRYENGFPPAYRADWRAGKAVRDVEMIEQLANRDEPIMDLYTPEETETSQLRCKLFSSAGVSLSDVLPTFEHMGAKVVDERPYEITPDQGEPLWVYDFGLRCVTEEAEQVRDRFQEAFLGVWRGDLEDDGFNGLVLHANLSGRQIALVRGIAKYLRQAGIGFSGTYMERTLLAHTEITVLLVRLFSARFHPDEHDDGKAEQLAEELEQKIDEVESLDEDRIFRAFLSVVQATLRTNYFRPEEAGEEDEEPKWKPYISFKLDPERIPLLPLPRPRFEIFVYSPRVEGVHLRGGKVARGGLRWSDRMEDFRTEVLGLMKAQMVKNALIVPVGSKGGFVVKRPPSGGEREALMEEGVECYKTFLRGLLDVTDNIVDGDVVPPEQVVRYDDDDPYLVVAADKGTASFSDTANEISASYGFWLGDAFASGGSRGYDHKEMGITAKGAWESVKRHFRELGTDIQSSEFTVVGIGDMSGDVFGNGMLLSPHIRLIGAFNHMHVFIDPDPDAERSYKERKRIFEMERSGWDDYDESKISEGGGVYSRSEKSISISKQVKEALDIDADELSPAELIRELMRAPVDLLWNGGIGTYVKASSESQADVGDKSNDSVRVDAGELRCKVVGEGGNLGFTQLGRVEFAQSGGRINTDAIDNVAGVNTSDHEVNIKILLGSLIDDGKLDEEQRNELLVEMTEAVSDQVLYASYTQTQAISLALAQAEPMIDVHARLIRHLEQVAGLNREIEFLPSDDEIADRKSDQGALLSPELAVVMAYCKIHLYSTLLESDLPEDSFLDEDLREYFPAPLPERY